MCFFKVGDPLAPCEHEECKKRLQALQLSSCLYNNDNKPAPNSMIIKPQPQYVAKRSRPEASGENLTSKQEDVLLKKIKTDETPNEEIGKKKIFIFKIH